MEENPEMLPSPVLDLMMKTFTPEKASMRMTKEAISFCIKRKELSANPLLNERLYLHNKGFVEITNLNKFTNV
jgi:hypothetical protein